ncbi:MAG: N-glycosylase/DNA lyase [Candidatus Omnitrophota bacterium]
MKSDREFLAGEYNKRKAEIKRRLGEFRSLGGRPDRDIFGELCFCLFTANANAVLCDRAIRELKDTGLLLKGGAREVRPKIRGKVRFHNKKALFLVGARRLFSSGPGGRLDIKSRIEPGRVQDTREWLVENVKGLGYKEASHFLRNIGLGDDIAILDRHILKNLKRYGVIQRIPSSLGSRKTYLEIEEKMRRFAGDIRIPMPELDLLFWSIQTGFVFK